MIKLKIILLYTEYLLMLRLLYSLIFSISLMETPATQELYIKNMTVSAGIYNDKIIVEWEGNAGTMYRIFRSTNNTADFSQIGETDKTRYEDTSAEKGIVYWYRVSPSNDEAGENKISKNDGNNNNPDNSINNMNSSTSATVENINNDLIDETEYMRLSAQPCYNTEKENPDLNKVEKNGIILNCYSGYAENDAPQGHKLKDLLKEKKAVLKIPSPAGEKALFNKRVSFLKNYYMHPVKFSLLLTMAQPYIDRGELLVFSGNEIYNINRKNKQFTFYNTEFNTYILFESSKLHKIFKKSRDNGLNDILLKNCELFCILNGRKIITDKAGITRIVYSYDAVGLSTRYLKNDSQWKSSTLMISTSRPDLKEKLMKAERTNRKDR